MRAHLFLKLATLPFRRSIGLTSLLILSFAQVMVALWFCGGIKNEIQKTQEYAEKGRFLTIQMRDEQSSIEPIRDLFKMGEVSFEEVKTETVLNQMEQDEAEVVQTVRSTGNEGLQLMPRLVVVRGYFTDAALEAVKKMKEVYRVDVSPIHHARLVGFYRHLLAQIKVATVLILFLIFVQLLVFERVQRRDAHEGFQNLSAWGTQSFLAKMPAFLSLLLASLVAFSISIGEWIIFQRTFWKHSPFLGELSLDRHLALPYGFCVLVLVSIFGIAFLLSFSKRNILEG